MADCDFSGFVDRAEFLGILDKMNACNKFGLENVRQIVEEIVPEKVSRQSFDKIFDLVKQALRERA